MNKIWWILCNNYIRFYSQIITGIFAVLCIIPVEWVFEIILNGRSFYQMTPLYFIIWFGYTIFLVFSGMLLPIFRRKRILHILNELVKKSKITAFQKKQIWLIIKDSMCYQSIFTKIGALRFLTFNIYGVAVIFAWNTIESTVWNIMHGDGLIPQFITGSMFFLAIWIADLIDKKVANEIKKEHKITEQSQSKMEKIYGEKYQVIVKLMEDVGGGSTETSKVGGILLEETIDDIKDIIDLSSSKKEAKIKRDLSKKSKIKKGKNEKVKMFGISLDKKKKKKTIHIKKGKKKRKITKRR